MLIWILVILARVNDVQLAALRQGPNIKVAAVASLATCGRFDQLRIWIHTSRTRSRRLTTYAIWPVLSEH